MQINLELRTPFLQLIVLTLVLVCEYFKVLMAVSLAIPMARLWRGGSVPGRWTAGRLRQLEPPPYVKRCLWSRWTLLRLNSAVLFVVDPEIDFCIKTGS